MREISVVVSNDNMSDPIDTIDAIKEAGFKNVFIQWYNMDWNVSQEEQLKYINKLGLNITFAHLGYEGIKYLWEKGNEGDLLVESFIEDLNICKKNNISLVIMHLSGRYEQEHSEIGLSRIRKIVNHAKSLGIKIAFENLRFKGCLEYILSNIKEDNVGICFDSGHYHCFYDDDFNFEIFKDKIFAIHLHDNDKSKDQHLLPFDGTINWDKLVYNLKESNYEGPITLEMVYGPGYLHMNIKDFYKESLKRAEVLSEKFENK